MKNLLPHITIILCVLMVGCTADNITLQDEREDMVCEPTGTPVLFMAGNTNQTVTRATTPYMAENGRFVCTMYYHAKATDTDASDFDIKDVTDGGTMTTAWLKVNNNVGNSVYRKGSYDETGMTTDDYNFDKEATCFYWQNRLTHAFLALADYNKLSTNTAPTALDLTTPSPATALGKLKLYPYWDKDFSALPETGEPTEKEQAAFDNTLSNGRYANTYDLTRGEIWNVVPVLDENNNPVLDENDNPVTKRVLTGYERNAITDQPDPILALTIMKPAGATQEANRVRLYFKHQFSQIQVNLKGADDNSANITADQIDKVELLGVSTEGYVCTRLNPDGSVGATAVGSGNMAAASAKDVRLDEFSDEVLVNNKWGTSFEMFDMATGEVEDGHDKGYATGYLKSYNAIAFGNLWAIRITWHEGTTLAPGIVHVSTFEVPQTNETNVLLRNLQSATKYVYDLEIRRGTLAVIRTQVLDWLQKDELVYGTDGTITN